MRHRLRADETNWKKSRSKMEVKSATKKMKYLLKIHLTITENQVGATKNNVVQHIV